MTKGAPLHAMINKGSADGPVIVLLHGRGSDERDLFPLGPLLHPDATVIAVRAPFDAAPWGYGPGYAWYQFLGGATPEAASFEQGQAELAAFLEALPAQIGRAGSPLILGGFSQGGTSALAFMMQHPDELRGVLVFSGFLADHPSVSVTTERVGSTPIFWGHGSADGAVPFELAEAGWSQLRAAGAQLEAHCYAGMSHTISEEELADARRWIAALLTGANKNGAR